MKKNPAKQHTSSEATQSDEQRMKTALKNSPIILFEHDRKLRYTWVFNPNPKFGNTTAQIIGKTDAELLPPSRSRSLTDLKRRVLASGQRARKEIAIQMNDETLYYDLTVEPLRDESGRVVGLACATFDITDRKQLESALQVSQNRYAMAEHLARLGHFVRDFEADTAYWSPEIYRIFGLDPREQAPSKDRFLAMLHPDDRENLVAKIHRVRSLGMEYVTEYRILRPDGQVRTIRVVIQPMPDTKGRSAKIGGILQDITREALFKQQFALMNHVEREAVFRDLHDTVCQELTGIGFLADSTRESLRQTPESALRDVEKIITSVQRAIVQARSIARNLKPLSDQPHALRVALEELAAYVESIYGVRCRFTSHKSVPITNGQVSTQLLLIAREAGINAARHAQARQIRITLSQNGEKVILRIADDGRGLPNLAKQKESGGLAVMQARAQIIGAGLSIGPGAKNGTVVECRWKKGRDEQADPID